MKVQEKGISKKDEIWVNDLMAQLEQIFDNKLDSLRQEIKMKRSSKSSNGAESSITKSGFSSEEKKIVNKPISIPKIELNSSAANECSNKTIVVLPNDGVIESEDGAKLEDPLQKHEELLAQEELVVERRQESCISDSSKDEGEKLELKGKEQPPEPYNLQFLHKSARVELPSQEFMVISNGTYENNIMFKFLPMDTTQECLESPSKSVQIMFHDGFTNPHSFNFNNPIDLRTNLFQEREDDVRMDGAMIIVYCPMIRSRAWKFKQAIRGNLEAINVLLNFQRSNGSNGASFRRF